MRINFLEAADGTALTKKYTKTDGSLQVDSYPFIKYFNSYEQTVETIEDLYNALTAHADKGHCLLKGMSKRTLKNERRVNTTLPNEKTGYIVIDNDFVEGFESVDQYLNTLSPTFNNVDYIFHHSSSAGTRDKPGIRGHIIILLENPLSPQVLKQWLIERNLQVPELRDQITLSANSMGVKWPLDTSTCQNDKLIYIANPTCIGFDDPLAGNRFRLVKRGLRKAQLNPTVNQAVNREATDTLVSILREQAGLKKRKAKYTTLHGDRVLKNPDEATVTGVQDCGDYIRLNLNNGNSWAYWHFKDKPNILYNFKDEPLVYIKDMLPEYHKTVYEKASTDQEQDQRQHIVFRDLATDTYYNGIYTPETRELEAYSASSVQKLSHFLMQHNETVPDYIEDWDYVFDPTTLKVFDPVKHWANKFSATKYLRDKTTKAISIPTSIDKVLTSICVDEPTKTHFVNWLAFIFQTRKKAGTAWIFHGTQGTGKGILFEHILQPLLGHQYVYEYNVQNLEDQFNHALEQTIIMWLDEFRVDDSKNGKLVINKLKNLITENQAIIRGMRKNPVKRQIYNNIIIATNDTDPIPIEDVDRRFNVAPPQEKRLNITAAEIDRIEEELPFFAAYLRDYRVNQEKVRTILENSARQDMVNASITTVNHFFDAIRKGDLDYFIQYVREKPPLNNMGTYVDFERAVRRWANTRDSETIVSNAEMIAVYNYIQNTNTTPSKFGKMCRIHRVEIKPLRDGEKTIRGTRTTFTGGDQNEIDAILKPDVVSIVKNNTP